ncbi:hypothetical protein MTR67_046915 [Solanum verrucosum]|uniref:Uncharacterized protein n=1 Tax=Solanum verrucosum TaxID=315347 RepID=A0AAF0UVI0_SOLVR|nr:hypothetical protein MTR67_046915 [Solanum verrucosum]
MAISMYISLSYSLPILQNPSITKTHFPFSPIHTPKSKICPRRKHFLIFAAENGGNNTENQENGLKNNGSSNGNGSNNGNGDGGGKPRLNLRWMDLLLDPDPDNIVAVGLTGLLTWASEFRLNACRVLIWSLHILKRRLAEGSLARAYHL